MALILVGASLPLVKGLMLTTAGALVVASLVLQMDNPCEDDDNDM